MKSEILSLNSERLIKLKDVLTINCENDKEVIGACYNFVRDRIKFGYNSSDDITALQVLKDGHGQCNTKATLLMSLLVLSGISVRIHGFTIDKRLQYGAITGLFYYLAPQEILHSWLEVKLENQWINLEGFILDQEYLNSIKSYIGKKESSFCGYGVACKDIQNPQVNWDGENSTYIQKEGIVRDLGLYETPEQFYKANGTNPKGIKKFLFKYIIRFIMNRNVERIRKRLISKSLNVIAKIEDINSV